MIGVLIFGASNATNVSIDLFASFVNRVAPTGLANIFAAIHSFVKQAFFAAGRPYGAR